MVGNTRKIQVDSDTEYQLPGTDGADGQFLKTNGTGITTWANAGSQIIVHADQPAINAYTPQVGDTIMCGVNMGDYSAHSLDSVTIFHTGSPTGRIDLGEAINCNIQAAHIKFNNSVATVKRTRVFASNEVTFASDCKGFEYSSIYCESFTLDNIDGAVTFTFNKSFVRCVEGDCTIGTGTNMTTVQDSVIDVNGAFIAGTAGVYLYNNTQVTCQYVSGSPDIKFNSSSMLTSLGMGLSGSGTNSFINQSGSAIATNVATDVAFVIKQQKISFNSYDEPCAFLATISGGVTHANNTTIDVVFDTESYDDGSNLNTTTGTFTAPCDGIYFFSTLVAYDDDSQWSDNDWMRVFLKKNTTLHQLAAINPNSQNSMGMATIGGSISIKLDASDTVVIQAYQNSDTTLEFSDGLARSFFSGHLVKRLG